MLATAHEKSEESAVLSANHFLRDVVPKLSAIDPPIARWRGIIPTTTHNKALIRSLKKAGPES